MGRVCDSLISTIPLTRTGAGGRRLIPSPTAVIPRSVPTSIPSNTISGAKDESEHTLSKRARRVFPGRRARNGSQDNSLMRTLFPLPAFAGPHHSGHRWTGRGHFVLHVIGNSPAARNHSTDGRQALLGYEPQKPRSGRRFCGKPLRQLSTWLPDQWLETARMAISKNLLRPLHSHVGSSRCEETATSTVSGDAAAKLA
jgi:hypothetical protein